MNFLKRGIASMIRRPGKSIILLFLVFILGAVISGALAVEGAISNTDANLRRHMRPIVTVELDWEAFSQVSDLEVDSPERFTSEVVRRIGDISYVSHFDYAYSANVGSFELERYQIPQLDYGSSLEWTGFRLMGSSRADLMDVAEGTISLVDGRMFTQAEMDSGSPVTLMSREVAEANHLEIGSVITVTNAIFNQTGDGWLPPSADNIFAYEDYELKIIGIFDVMRRDIDSLSDFDAHQERNRIGGIIHRLYVPNSIASQAQLFTHEQQHLMILENDLPSWWFGEESVSAFFVLDDPFDLEAFRTLAEPMLPEFWRLIDLTDTFDAISTSMIVLQDIADWVLTIAIFGSLAVLSLLIMLFLRDRRYEIGVYIALGEKKLKVVMQVVMEIVVTSMVGIAFAVFLGNLVAANLSQSMLRTELIAATEEIDWGAAMFADPNALTARWGGMGIEELSLEEMMASFDVTLDMQTIMTFYGLGLVVVIASTALPMLYLIKMDPKKILMDAKS